MSAVLSYLSRYLPRSQFQRHAAMLSGGVLLSQFVQTASIPVLTRLYRPDVFGKWAILISGAAIVSAIVVLSQSLGLAVTAEGVETEEQLRLLHAMSCGTVQGYLLGRPVPAPSMVHYLLPLHEAVLEREPAPAAAVA